MFIRFTDNNNLFLAYKSPATQAVSPSPPTESMLRQCIYASRHHQLSAAAMMYNGLSDVRLLSVRNFASPNRSPDGNALETARERNDVSTDVRPIGERIKENTKTASYMGVIVLGVTVTGALMFAIFKELWSSCSPNNVYSAALEKCVNVRPFILLFLHTFL